VRRLASQSACGGRKVRPFTRRQSVMQAPDQAKRMYPIAGADHHRTRIAAGENYLRVSNLRGLAGSSRYLESTNDLSASSKSHFEPD